MTETKITDRDRLMLALGLLEEHGLTDEAAALYPEDVPLMQIEELQSQGGLDVPVFGDPDWNEEEEQERLNRERRERIADGEEMAYCEGCERVDVPLVTGRIMPGATVPVEWCHDCIAKMPRPERVTWGLPPMTTTREVSTQVRAVSKMDAVAQIVAQYGVDQWATKVEAVRTSAGLYQVTWREANR